MKPAHQIRGKESSMILVYRTLLCRWLVNLVEGPSHKNDQKGALRHQSNRQGRRFQNLSKISGGLIAGSNNHTFVYVLHT